MDTIKIHIHSIYSKSNLEHSNPDLLHYRKWLVPVTAWQPDPDPISPQLFAFTALAEVIAQLRDSHY